GNPLAVIPDASALPEDRLQKIAREFNFSETTFVYPPQDARHTARVRIFTPTMEVPFAGHPTIGTAIALCDLGRGSDLVLELGVGPIPCRVDAGAAEFITTHPLQVTHSIDVADCAACLSLPAQDIRTDQHPPVMASVGLGFVLVALTGRDALSRIQTATDAFRQCADKYPSELDFAILAYTRAGDDLQARVFAPLDNIPEDPATGSAAAALTAYLSQREGRSLSLRIAQGVEMGRPSLILARAEAEGGAVSSVAIGGQAVRVMQGRLTL
ncbi:MAG: PhzF family phenazine biosynthesis protein, partial [Alphaproteobacteria bacterium]|nr:PhzF family phenazine biosynthesis protein [Alphaproteobacteria bacterium]